MTLDEAIEHGRQVFIDKADESLNCDNECAREHWQLAEWLTELKLLRDAYGERQKEHSQLIIEHSDALYEIDELRELVRDMMRFFEDGDWCTICEQACKCESQEQYEEDCLMRDVFHDRMRELGVETGE